MPARPAGTAGALGLLRPVARLGTTVILTAVDPKIPPFKGDGARSHAAGAATVTLVTAAVMMAAAAPKYPTFQGD